MCDFEKIVFILIFQGRGLFFDLYQNPIGCMYENSI